MRTCVLVGLQPREAEVRASASLSDSPDLEITGDYPDAQKRETRVRVLGSLVAMGVRCRATVEVVTPTGRLGSELDLAIGLAVLESLGKIELPEGLYCRAELGLNGSLLPLRGTFACLSQKRFGVAIVSEENADEAADAMQKAIVCKSLADAAARFVRRELRTAVSSSEDFGSLLNEIAADLVSWAARDKRGVCIIGQLPRMAYARHYRKCLQISDEDALIVRQVRSAAGIYQSNFQIPFRAPHHSVSIRGLVGPEAHFSEFSLAHGGVLCLDEIDQFRTEAIVGICRAQAEGLYRPCIVGLATPPKDDNQAARWFERMKERTDALGLEVIRV